MCRIKSLKTMNKKAKGKEQHRKIHHNRRPNHSKPFAILIPHLFKHPKIETMNWDFLYIIVAVTQLKNPSNPTMPQTIATIFDGVIGLGGGGTGPGGIDQQTTS
jgi:hypothetical protein